MRRVFSRVRRAAFDIGSGSTKIQCSEYEYPHEIKEIITGITGKSQERERETGRILSQIYSEERPVPFGVDYLNSSDGNLSEELQLLGLQFLIEMKNKAENVGATQFSAIATEVFRKAKNGNHYLDRVRALGIPVTLVTQDVEAELGYRTAAINSGREDLDQICVWDSGGSSFQFSHFDGSLQTYMAPIGSSASASYLATIKGIPLNTTPNPVTFEESQQLISVITSNLPSSKPIWLNEHSSVIAICGKNSIFKVCCNVLEELSKGLEHIATTPPGLFRRNTSDYQPPPNTVHSFTLQQAETALDICLNCSDELLCKYVNFQYSDGPKIVIPKLSLVVAVMKYLNIKEIETIQCIGSCSAVICDEKYW